MQDVRISKNLLERAEELKNLVALIAESNLNIRSEISDGSPVSEEMKDDNRNLTHQLATKVGVLSGEIKELYLNQIENRSLILTKNG